MCPQHGPCTVEGKCDVPSCELPLVKNDFIRGGVKAYRWTGTPDAQRFFQHIEQQTDPRHHQ